ncbi:cysteine proteinase [Morchella conica CCBAS932]|uniref:Ubiquitin carboxyl-terminal hydrolase n=1 Tax=Morchella conica CCBAS932 TaxID=1392247 RepID=A0A3N4KBU4_9PEZI|nr:cysteine proteinase [Morchella conica CCBAS932]
MPAPNNKQLTIAYAAGASLAAVTLVYVFGPTWFIDSNPSSSQRKKGVVGLVNTANDCFINSILQSLAGLGELRAYLVRRTRAAKANGEFIEGDEKPFLTAALKDILDGLNERPLYRKTLSARPFLTVLERVFRQRISRSQQDAHEFLQVVAETIAEEYHKQKKSVKAARVVKEKDLEDEKAHEEEEAGGRNILLNVGEAGGEKVEEEEDGVIINVENSDSNLEDETEDEGGMPLEGKVESEIECQKCHFKPKPTVSTFVVLTLPVPQKSSTTLSDCIKGVLSTEYIDDFQCARCRLEHAIATLTRKIASTPVTKQGKIQEIIDTLRQALEKDPEKIPEGIDIPPSSSAPKSRIARRTRMSSHPRILALHLSRSIYEGYSSSRKNSARVSFPETLQMGGIMEKHEYKLLCMVTHKGGHESGHYECFRRQIVSPPPYSTPTPTLAPSTPAASGQASPIGGSTPGSTVRLVDPREPGVDSPSLSPYAASSNILPSDASSSLSSSDSKSTPSPSLLTPDISSIPEAGPGTTADSAFEKRAHAPNKVRKKHGNNKWWRISDDKIRETKTGDVLGMQKEVYLLFYEEQKPE